MPRAERRQGFTLLEVLIALTILAISSLAVIRQVGQGTVNLTLLEQKTLAALVADQRISQYRIAESWPALGSGNERTEWAGQDWQVSSDVETTSEPLMRKVTVSVALDAGADQRVPLSEFVLYRGRYQ
jgi:general secretion pathway protein I